MSIQNLTSTVHTLGKLAFVFSLSFGLIACTAQSGQNTRPSQVNTIVPSGEVTRSSSSATNDMRSASEPVNDMRSRSGPVNDMRSGGEPVNDMRFDDVVEEDAPVKRRSTVNDMRY